jgi:S-layer family protein
MRSRIALLVVLALAFSAMALAQGIPVQQTYGTASDIVYTLGPWNFEDYDSTVTTAVWSSNYRYITAGCCLIAPVHLPNGALVTAIDMEACDGDPSTSVVAQFNVCVEGPVTCVSSGRILATGVTTGCGRFGHTFAPADQVQINNKDFNYAVQLTTGNTFMTAFGPVRLRYHLQVSSAPATATFSDVPPSHPFYQFIEALAASGVTSGCNASPPQFCPDAPLTRGQMAVFLARALGLHFPN